MSEVKRLKKIKIKLKDFIRMHVEIFLEWSFRIVSGAIAGSLKEADSMRLKRMSLFIFQRTERKFITIMSNI